MPDVLFEQHVRELDDWVTRAPAADGVESPSYTTGAFGHIVNWRKTLRLLVEHVGTDLAAPPARHEQYTKWTKPLADLGARDIKPLDGTPTEITIDAEPFLAHAEQLFAIAPIDCVRVRGAAGAHIAKLAALPELAKLTTLDLGRQGLDDAGLGHLVRSRYLGKLEHLMLHENELTDAGIETLAAASKLTLKSLKSVDLNSNPAKDPTDESWLVDETTRERFETERGKQLEAKYGPLPWLHG